VSSSCELRSSLSFGKFPNSLVCKVVYRNLLLQGTRFIVPTSCMFQSFVMPRHLGVSFQLGTSEALNEIYIIYPSQRYVYANVALLVGPIAAKNDCYG
jgi:hypothetical protein